MPAVAASSRRSSKCSIQTAINLWARRRFFGVEGDISMAPISLVEFERINLPEWLFGLDLPGTDVRPRGGWEEMLCPLAPRGHTHCTEADQFCNPKHQIGADRMVNRVAPRAVGMSQLA